MVKMNILPKFLYLFQALPIAIPKYYFKQIHSLLVRFIWANKHPRISRALLTIPKQKGGLAVPDMYKYYQAALLSRLIDWSRHGDGKLWPGQEQAQSSALLQRAAWCYKDLPTITRAHPVIGPTLKIGFELFSKGKLSAIISPLFPILGNPQFEPGLRKGNFMALMEQGIFQASHFLTGEAWPTIFSLTTGSLPYCLDFWRAVQLRHFLNTLSSYGRTLTIFEEYCNGSGVFHQTLSKTYALLIAPSEDFRLPFFRGWERDLGRTFTEEQCTNMIHNIFESSICIKMQETNFKILSRWYRTPAFLNRCYPEVSDNCWRCGGKEGMLMHIFWSCPRIENFWKEVRRIAKKFSDQEIPEDPSFFLLQDTKIPVKSYKKSILCHLLNAARACIPLTWKQAQTPTVGLWLKRVEQLNLMEDLVWTSRQKRGIYLKTWSPWNLFINTEEGKNLIDVSSND